MYVSLRDEDHTDQMLMGRKAAGQRIAARIIKSTAYLGPSPNLNHHYANPLADVPTTPAIDEMMRYFEALLTTPALPARCPTPAATKPLPPLEVIATPAKTTLTRKETGRAGVLVSFDGKSVQAGEGNLAEAIQAVAPKAENTVAELIATAIPLFAGAGRMFVTIPGYQGTHEVMRVETTASGQWFAFKLLADRDALTRFRAADCALVYVQGGEVAA